MALTKAWTTKGLQRRNSLNGLDGNFGIKLGTGRGAASVNDTALTGTIQHAGSDLEILVGEEHQVLDSNGNSVSIGVTGIANTSIVWTGVGEFGFFDIDTDELMFVGRLATGDTADWTDKQLGNNYIFDLLMPVFGHTGSVTMNITNSISVGVSDASITPVKLDANTAAKRQAFRTKIGIEDFSTMLTDAATIAWNLDTSEIAEVTLAGNRTLAVPANGREGRAYMLKVIQDSTGSRTLTLHSSIDTGGLDAPELSTTGGKADFLFFIKDGSTVRYFGIRNDE